MKTYRIERETKPLWVLAFLICLLTGYLLITIGCSFRIDSDDTKKQRVVDQLGRHVVVPRKIERIATLNPFAGKVVFALRQQEKMVHQGLFLLDGKAMARLDPSFAKKPKLMQNRGWNREELVALKPDVTFVYASFSLPDIELMENAGLKVVALKGETLAESYIAVRLIAKVLGCEQRGEEYIGDCEKLMRMVRERARLVPSHKKLKVMCAGPKGVYTVATGQMLQNEIVEAAGGRNVASTLKGFWVEVSPEQVARWNPDVIFLGSNLGLYGNDELYKNRQFETVQAVKNRRVYLFPSNVDLWDYPPPHCVLGALWAGKTLYPEQFKDVDLLKITDAFYTKYLGYSFTAMGGRI